MNLIRSLRLAAVAVTLAGTVVAVQASTPAAQAAIGGLTWSDEFDGAAGSAPNQSRWRYDVGGGGWGNNELQYYTTSTSNAQLNGAGHLVITARRENPAGYGCWYGSCQYTSARLLTSATFTQTYGKFEARLKIPRGQGIWPAFWMLGNDIGSVGWPTSGEIDIMENIGRPSEQNRVYGTLHGPGYSGGEGISSAYVNPGGAPFADAFHTFAVEWGPDYIAWIVDGVQYARKGPGDLGGDRWVFDHPFFMIMNVAVGGNWPGSPDGATTFPQEMVVDYVRVYGWTNGGGTTNSIVGAGSNRCVDIPSANAVDGARLQIWDCNGSSAQRWTFNADGTVTALGKCMDVSGGSSANGAAIQLWNCNGSGAQKFVLSAAGDLVNIQANKCVDVANVATANGSPLHLWECTGASNQKWRKA
jgi:beta-glucanase (GH16 family)